VRWTTELVCADGRNMLTGKQTDADGVCWTAHISSVYGPNRDMRFVSVERMPAESALLSEPVRVAHCVVPSSRTDDECKEIVEKTIREWEARQTTDNVRFSLTLA